MKKINQSGPFGRCLAGEATLTIDGKVVGTFSNFKADSVEIEPGDIRPEDLAGTVSNFVFASSDRDALKPDNGDRRFATIDIEARGFQAPQARLHPHQEAAMKDMQKAAGAGPLFKFDLPLVRENLQAVTDTGKAALKKYGHRINTPEPAKDVNHQMEFYRTMLGEPWPNVNTDASLFGVPDIIAVDEPMRTQQMREDLDVIEAHLKSLPPPAPYSPELRRLAGGTFGKTLSRTPSMLYADAGGGEPLSLAQQRWGGKTLAQMLDADNGSNPDVRLRAFGKSLPGALFRSGDPLKFVGGNFVGYAFMRKGAKRDIAMERVHHHVDHWTVRRRSKGMIDSLPKRLRMAIVIHRAFRGPL